MITACIAQLARRQKYKQYGAGSSPVRTIKICFRIIFRSDLI